MHFCNWFLQAVHDGVLDPKLYFMYDGATAHTATYSINVLNKVFENSLISRGLWPARSPDLNPCDFICGEI
jgi:hypothetical protein